MKPTPPDITDDFSLVSPPDPYAWVLPTVIGLAVLFIVGLVLWRYYQQRQQPSQGSQVPPEVSARDGLAASRRMLDDGRYKEFVIEVSRVLRIYIEDRFELRAPHLSTEEFLFEAEDNHRLPKEWQKSLGDFLFECDRVKFALANTEPLQMEVLYSTAEKFIGRPDAAVFPPQTRSA